MDGRLETVRRKIFEYERRIAQAQIDIDFMRNELVNLRMVEQDLSFGGQNTDAKLLQE